MIEYFDIPSSFANIPKIALLNNIRERQAALREQIQALQQQLQEQEAMFKAVYSLPHDAVKSEEELERIRHHIATGGEVVEFSPVGVEGENSEVFTTEERLYLFGVIRRDSDER